MRKAGRLLLLMSLSVVGSSAVEVSGRKITTAQARSLVMASLTADQARLPGVEAEPYDVPPGAPPRFMVFTVTWAGTRNGSVVVGNYAVDPYTGDIFSATASCYEERNRNLGALQTRIRATLHLSRSEYLKLKTKGPLCDE